MSNEVSPEVKVVEPIRGVFKGSSILTMEGFSNPVQNEITHLMDGVNYGITRMLSEGFKVSGMTDIFKINTEDGYIACIAGDQIVSTKNRGDVIAYELREQDIVLLYNATLLELKDCLSTEQQEKIKEIVNTIILNSSLTTSDITNNVILEIEGNDLSKLQLDLLELGIKCSYYNNLVVNGTHLSRLMDLIGLYDEGILETYNEQVKLHGLDSRFNEFSSPIGTIEYLGLHEAVEPKNHNFDLTYVCNGVLIKN